MKPNYSILLLPLLLAGCSTSTTNPSPTVVAQCRQDMCIVESLDIEPLGFQMDYAVDASKWFKFVAQTDDIQNVFTDKVDTKSFRNEMKFSGTPKPKWWDAEKHNLIGGQAQVANDCFIDVGYKKNEDGTLTVFIYWGET